MIALKHSLFEIPETEIHRTKVLRTIFQGNDLSLGVGLREGDLHRQINKGKERL